MSMRFRGRIYWVVFVYMILVAANAALVVALFAMRTGGMLEVPWTTLSGYALGTGGLGAGSLVFKKPIERLFA
jgi:hypothetical protein